jgi:uncharacterized membrane protein
VASEGGNAERSEKYPRWLGLLEILAGVALIVKGCHYSVTHDDTLSTMAYIPATLVAIVALILPGLLLRSEARLRLLGQVLPALLLVWAVVALVAPSW